MTFRGFGTKAAIAGGSLVASIAWGSVGAWFREVPTAKQAALVKGTQLIKAGVFSKRGTFAPRPLPKRGEADCLPREGWLTHRLASGEKLSGGVGERLGEQLARFAPAHCLAGIELDIEPLPSPPPWLGEFVLGVRAKLPKEISLSLAVPPIRRQSKSSMAGLSWTEEEAMAVLMKVDALDLMIYDTGATEVAAYATALKDAVGFAARALKVGKRVRLGIPSYSDKTKMHRSEVERLAIVRAVFEEFSTGELEALCDPKTEWLVYAGWTISSEESKELEKLTQWRSGGCQKSDVKPPTVQ